VTDNHLIAVNNSYSLDPDQRILAANEYYTHLGDSYLPENYYSDYYNSYLSHAFQVAHSFDQWRAEIRNLVSLSYATLEVADGSIRVDLTRTDSTPTGNVT
jgi:hypothetical protein